MELGNTLRQAREHFGYSLEEAAAATRIRRSFLEALESENLAALPQPIFARGILRSYAQFLTLDPAPFLQFMPEPEEVEIESPTAISLSNWRAQGSWVIGGIVIALLVVTLLYLQGVAAPTSESSGPLLLELPTPTATTVPAALGAPAPSVSPTATPQATPTPGGATPTPSPTAVALVLAIVPNVVGQPYGTAEIALRNAGFNVVRQEQSGGTPGQVLAQEPPGGQSLPADSVITLRVASNTTTSAQIAVPEIVGRTEAEARDLLRRAGLSPSPWTNYQDMESLPPNLRRPVCVGCVLSSSPSAGSQVNPGATVNLAVRSS